LLLLSPVMLLIAALVKLTSPGPVFYRQERCGLNGKSFHMLKFRSMRVDAEQQTGAVWAVKDDPRKTRLGAFLRKTSLDELPQLLNVLKGDMSLVGPRPTSFAPETYRLWHTERLEVMPGITGLWQISGRSNLDFDQRLKLDIAYIERQSMWMDICIIARTVGQVFIGEGAY